MATETRPLPATADDMLAELIEINAELEPLAARKAEIEKYLRGLEPGRYTNGALDVTISPSKRFNKKAFAEKFPYDKHPEFYKTTVEPDTRSIAPNIKDLFSDVHDNRLIIK